MNTSAEFKPTDALRRQVVEGMGVPLIDTVSFERIDALSFQLRCYSAGVLMAELDQAIYIEPRSGVSLNNLEIPAIGLKKTEPSIFSLEGV